MFAFAQESDGVLMVVATCRGYLPWTISRQTQSTLPIILTYPISFVQNVRVNHSGRYVVVAEQLPNGTDAMSRLEQMRRETMAQRVLVTYKIWLKTGYSM